MLSNRPKDPQILHSDWDWVTSEDQNTMEIHAKEAVVKEDLRKT